MDKLQNFQVVLGSVDRIQKELDELRCWINLQILETRGIDTNFKSMKQVKQKQHKKQRFGHLQDLQDQMTIEPVKIKSQEDIYSPKVQIDVNVDDNYIIPHVEQDQDHDIDEQMDGTGTGSYSYNESSASTSGLNDDQHQEQNQSQNQRYFLPPEFTLALTSQSQQGNPRQPAKSQSQSQISQSNLLSLTCFKCSICEKQFRNSAGLYYHKQCHLEKNIKCPLVQCNELFKTKDNLRTHMQRKHPKEVVFNFKCFLPNCDKSFSTQKALDTHLSIHSGLKCQFCQSIYFDKHLYHVHLNKKHHFCTYRVCKEKFKSKIEYEKHKIEAHSQS